MQFSTPFEYLSWIASQQAVEIKLGLDRVAKVAKALDIKNPLDIPVITVGGTNGKGTTITALESIYLNAGYSVGTFTSPYLFIPNEQIRINGFSISDALFCEALNAVDSVRLDTSLTVFEYQTLAALWLFTHSPVDVWLLEVGLGGRLDAVNIMDADVSIVTSIDLDHMQYLGETREAIGREKAGIFRSQGIAICGDRDPPASLRSIARALDIKLWCAGEHFDYAVHDQYWHWNSEFAHYTHLPKTHFLPQNLSTALMAINRLKHPLPVSPKHIHQGLLEMRLPGRLEKIQHDRYQEIHDVAHNPAAIEILAKYLRTNPCAGKTYAVFSMLADKDISTSLNAINNCIDHWYVAPLQTSRAATLTTLQEAFVKAKPANTQFFNSIGEAYSAVPVTEADRLVVFGSFHTVAEVRSLSEKRAP